MRLFIIAGELSGDRLGGDLMQELTDMEFAGVGGPHMAQAGLGSLFDMSDLSVMGLVEILPRIPKLLARVRRTAKAAIAFKPDAIITIDSPDFCFRVVKKVKQALPDVPVIHYVAPSVWAWRPERAAKMAAYVDHVLALLPFEPPYMTAEGMSCDFVGHPTAKEPPVTLAEVTAFTSEFGFGDRPLVTLLPGSRAGEIKRMAPLYSEVIDRVLAGQPKTAFILPVAPGREAQVRAAFSDMPSVKLLFQEGPNAQDQKRIAYAASDAALATSGTVALELAAADCPMVVAYRANAATTRMVKKLAQIDTANLVNIVTETRIVPEFLFEAAEPAPIADALLSLLGDRAAQAAQRAALRHTMTALNSDLSAGMSVKRFLGA